MVARAGFEPAISALKELYPGPLDERAIDQAGCDSTDQALVGAVVVRVGDQVRQWSSCHRVGCPQNVSDGVLGLLGDPLFGTTLSVEPTAGQGVGVLVEHTKPAIGLFLDVVA